MRRRQFITPLGGAAVAWPLTARAQQPGKLPTIGYLGGTSRAAESQWRDALTRRLGELGWIEGRTVAIEYRWAEGRSERAAEIAAEYVRLKVDVIITAGTPLIIAAKRVTSTIPIVFATAGDPVGTGLVDSLPRPGGNVTGLSVQAADLAGKKLEFLRDIVPGLRRLAILADVTSPAGVVQMSEAIAAAETLGLDTVRLEVRGAEDFAPAFESLNRRADAITVANGPLMATHRILINTLALSARLPTVHGGREHIEAGGLISYAPNFPDLHRRAADLIDKILRGTKPGNIPVEQPTKFDLPINLKTAKTLGLQVPDKLLALADEVIE
jgi:putative tryptophan/tyrosine transport system substrate-binding protein